MGRKRDNTLRDLIEIGASVPWWVALLLAAGSYVGLHLLAIRPVPVPTGSHDMGLLLSAQLIQSVASIAQYVLPGALTLGAILSVARRRRRANIYQNVAGQRGKDALNGISWRDFELLVGEWFRRQGYTVTETSGAADGGVDLILSRHGETSLVQCKQWKAFKVGVKIIRELLGVMVARGASGGFVVTSGVFTAEAIRFAADCNIALIDGGKLSALLREAPRELTSRDPPAAQAPPTTARTAAESPKCPTCGAAMVLRRAAKGARAGQSFWGCATFPNCRGTRALSP